MHFYPSVQSKQWCFFGRTGADVESSHLVAQSQKWSSEEVGLLLPGAKGEEKGKMLVKGYKLSEDEHVPII